MAVQRLSTKEAAAWVEDENHRLLKLRQQIAHNICLDSGLRMKPKDFDAVMEAAYTAAHADIRLYKSKVGEALRAYAAAHPEQVTTRADAPDVPDWCTGDELSTFQRWCNMGDAAIDTVLGLPRRNWPSRPECKAIMTQYKHDQGQEPADDLNFWFPRDKDGNLMAGDPTAKQELARLKGNWLYLDTETTGLRPADIPVTIGAVNPAGEVVLDMRIAPLDSKGGLITPAAEATKVNGLTFEAIKDYPPLYDQLDRLTAVITAEPTLAGYNTTFDREMILKALGNAKRGTPSDQHKQLAALGAYFADAAHWFELKELLTEAAGVGGDKPWKVRLTHLIEAVLPPGTLQAHGAVADCLHMRAIVEKLTEGVEAPPSVWDIPLTQPKKEQTVTTVGQESKGRAMTEARAEIDDLKAQIARLEAEVTRLKEAPRASADHWPTHQEAPTLAYTDLVINGHKVSVTARDGANPETVVKTVWALMDACRTIYADERTKEYTTMNGFNVLKTLKPPTNGSGKPAAAPEDNYQPSADDKPAQPKNPPTQTSQPENGAKPGSGDRQSFKFKGVFRFNGKTGGYTYEMDTWLNNGQRTQQPTALSSQACEQLEKALIAQGIKPDSLPLGDLYPIAGTMSWVKGREFSEGKFYRDDMQFSFA